MVLFGSLVDARSAEALESYIYTNQKLGEGEYVNLTINQNCSVDEFTLLRKTLSRQPVFQMPEGNMVVAMDYYMKSCRQKCVITYGRDCCTFTAYGSWNGQFCSKVSE